MAKSAGKPVQLADIQASLRIAAEKFLKSIAKEHPGETLYGFLFEISCEGFSASGTAATEEGLHRFAEQYVATEGGKLAAAKAKFRWGSPEDAWYQQPDAPFNAVNKLLSRANDQRLYEECTGVLETLCIAALKDLDAASVFGTGPTRERIAIGVCYIGGDNTPKEFLAWAKQVNPSSVFKRLQKDYKLSNE